MSAPVIIRDDIRQLLASTGEDPVLYLKAGPDDEGGSLEVDVWVSAYVHRSKVIVHRHEVVDALGDSPDDDEVDDYLTMLEQTVEDVAAGLA
ncbi:hypothetical protein ABZ023_17890 [Streptomyces sp. NPDC006367]|uniref:hypothetical protein n=1 Tax=unclassified Streptomyces TaxID=2593676 RepID=UPI0033B7D523